ncbi:LacI family DNA-binding transcriptional regulator [Frondihabitans australicus]|uniref:LacI family transcriptional regulator n=1 Tax=Frondihabitans australicus TaxID=386892 RepID=A0A495IE13_9MICO|nr:LacI family DNA-binding transcriptional regulator [Frondihabitans australicus]RKR73365.1 LacI family transcriptional regulator [Frondihabitans australicus]
MNRRVTIVDVAERAGVAISSASSALNGRPGVSEATRRRIQAAADELGFVPSLRGRSLSTQRAYAVGLIVNRDPDVFEEDPFFGGFLGGIESVLARRGYALVLQMSTTAAENTERYRRMALDRRVDGVFLNEILVGDPRIPVLRELQVPTVAITEGHVSEFPAVVQDSAHGIRDLVDHLVSQGHRAFAHVSGPPAYEHANRRRDVWLEALAAHGIEGSTVVEGDFTYAGGAAAASSLLGAAGGDPARPTAVFCANDLTAAGFVARALDLGLTVPGDLSVAGFDGTALGTYVRPSLTTLTSSPRSLGALAASLLLDRIDGREVADVAAEPSTLVVRDSTGPAPHAA